jgi:hypothetical protein
VLRSYSSIGQKQQQKYDILQLDQCQLECNEKHSTILLCGEANEGRMRVTSQSAHIRRVLHLEISNNAT